MCELARVSRACFYRDWQERQPEEVETALRGVVQNVALSQRSYGYPQAPGSGLVHHPDRGTQYANKDYVQRLEKAEMVTSMSRPARPWENAYCESFMSTLKRGQIHCPGYATLEELQTQMTQFIEQFYTSTE